MTEANRVATTMDSLCALVLALKITIALTAAWQQMNSAYSRQHARFHYRSSASFAASPPSLIALSYGEEVLGIKHRPFGQWRPAVPLRLDYHNRSQAESPDERRLVLCVFWPTTAELYPEFPFAKVCR